MATAEEDRPMDEAASNADAGGSPRDVAEPERLKRKASRDDEDEASPKRARHGEDDAHSPIDRRPRQDSSPSRRDSYGDAPGAEQDRRASATQEERKRGKRLFGGLLSTLSQTTGSSQQKRRLEIERRQQERLQRQKVEDDKERAEKRARLTEIRMGEQMGFEEEVMRNKHSKMLAVAQFLKTKAQPQIFYLPWKPTPEQEDEIDGQIRNAKETIQRELDAFEARKQRHGKGRERPARVAQSPTPEKQLATAPPSDDVSVDKPEPAPSSSEPPAKAPDKQQEQHQHNHHEEAADVLEEADEDMVIY